MKTIIGAFVMTMGVIMLSWNLYCIYHQLPLSAPAFFAGLICARLGVKWVQGESPRAV